MEFLQKPSRAIEATENFVLRENYFESASVWETLLFFMLNY